MLLFTLVALSMEPAPAGKAKTAHVIVLGNEKGGSGKSTTAMHRHRRAAQGRATRRLGRHRQPPALAHPLHRESRRAGRGAAVSRSSCRPTTSSSSARGEVVREIEAQEFTRLCRRSSTEVEREFDFVVVDTPASNSYLMRLSHAMADTLITPINDSFIDLDVLGRVDPASFGGHRHQPLCRTGARARAASGDRVDGGRDGLGGGPQPHGDARQPQPATRPRARSGSSATDCSTSASADGDLGARHFPRALPRGLTAFDTLDAQTLGGEPTMSHVAGAAARSAT